MLSDVKRLDRPHTGYSFCLRRREGRPIVLARKEKRSLPHLFNIERASLVQRVAIPERRHDARVEDSIDVGFSSGRIASMKIVPDHGNLHHSHITWKITVNGCAKPFGS